MTWNLLFTVKDGHRYFENGNGEIAVADDSGDTPDQTDDGVLWVNRQAPIIVAKDGCLIPLRIPGGEATRTPAGIVEALEVAWRLDVPILTDHGSYVITKV